MKEVLEKLNEVKEEIIEVVIEDVKEETLDEMIENDSLVRNDDTNVSTTDNVEEPVKKKRGRKKKAN